MESAVVNDRIAILRRLIDPDRTRLTPDGARFLLSITFPEEDQARVSELIAKAQKGSLTPEERRELDDYIHIGNMLAIWHSKARRLLKQTDNST